MKGDFTRFTFQPKKHYSSVLMQQGRLQLDADWNEQMSILNHLGQLQTRDLIGSAAGTSQLEGGFQVLPVTPTNAADILITNGRFYVDGILCELNRGTSIEVEWRSQNLVQVRVLTLDGQAFAANQWVELQVLRAGKTESKFYKITQVNSNDFTLQLSDTVVEPPTNQSIVLRRLTTYKTQADYPDAATPAPGINLVYLDVWQRHVTSLDDRTLQEVALNGLDTTTRIQTIAQVKLLNITADLIKKAEENKFDTTTELFNEKPSVSNLEALPIWKALSRRSVLMNATTATDPTSSIDTSGNYLGGDNRLYRVEIHRSGPLSQATFKWSRDNGSIVSAIAKVEGDIIFLKGSVQDEYNLFAGNSQEENPWVELITEAQELNNQPGVLVQIRDVKPPNLLLIDPSTVQGSSFLPVPQAQAEQAKLKVRRWDNQLSTSDEWQLLERGIRVQFNSKDNASFQTGDYWLISARADQPVEWPRDLPQARQQLGLPIAQPPVGIEHHFGILAVVKTDAQSFNPAVEDDAQWTKSDLRATFLPLIDRGEASGIGVSDPEARLHVRGNSSQSSDGKIKKTGDNPQVIEISETKARILRGYTITIGTETALVTNAIVTKVDNANLLKLTLEPAIANLPADDQQPIGFKYQQPIIRFESSDAIAPRFFINGVGNVGINTFNPAAKFEIRGIETESTDLLQINQAAGSTVLKVKPDGGVGIGVDRPSAKLDVRDTFRVTTDSAFVNLQAGSPVLFTSHSANTGYSFDQGLIVKAGGITVENNGGARISGRLSAQNGITISADGLTVENNGGARISGLLTAQNGVTVEAGGLTVKGDTVLSDASGQERVSVRGNAIALDGDITLKNSGSDRIEIRNTETKVNGDLNLATGDLNLATGNLKIPNGTLTIGDSLIDGDGIQVNRFRREVTFTNNVTITDDFNVFLRGAEKITLSHDTNSVVINLPNQQLSLQSGNNSLVTLAPFRPDAGTNNPKLNVAGNVTIGSGYSNRSNAGLIDGLLVQGRVGIGTFDAPVNLAAKLEVRGGSISDRDGVLNVTNQNRDSLLFVRNDGQVYVATRGLNPAIADLTDEAKQAIKFYVEGNAYINGNLFAQQAKAGSVTGGNIEQLSSRTLKENITTLSTQEATTLLEKLNPVKFNYTFPTDSTLHAGFIAEEVPDLLTSPDHQAVRLLDVVAVLTKIVQEQQSAIAALSDRITQLETSKPRR